MHLVAIGLPSSNCGRLQITRKRKRKTPQRALKDCFETRQCGEQGVRNEWKRGTGTFLNNLDESADILPTRERTKDISFSDRQEWPLALAVVGVLIHFQGSVS